MKRINGLAWSSVSINFCVFFLACHSLVFGQEFPKDRSKFIKEAQKQFTAEDMAFNVRDVFPTVIENPSLLSDAHFNRMVDGANAVLKSTSDIQCTYYFVASHVYQAKNKLGSEFFSTWIGLDKDYREKEFEDYFSFLQFSYNLFRYKALYKDENTVWTFKGSLEWNTEKKLKIVCTDGQLLGYSPANKKEDSVFVAETSGIFDYESKKFNGRFGVLTWEKTGLKKNDTYADLGNYKIGMTDLTLKADTVSLTTEYFKAPIKGSLVDDIGMNADGSYNFPKFTSFDFRLKIEELKEGVDYDGGFSLQGNRMVGTGVKDNPAKLIYKFNGKTLFEISSIGFTVDPTGILSRIAQLKMIYPNGETLTHEEGLFQFYENENQFYFTAAKRGNLTLPFRDNHFQVSCNSPVLKWEINTPYPKYTFELATSQEQKVIQFESLNYFDEQLYKGFGSNSNNPIAQIYAFAKKNNLNVLTEGQASTAMNTTIETAKSKLLELAAMGFLGYETFEKRITLQPKLYAYAEAATSKADYDNVAFRCDLTERIFDVKPAELEENPALKAEKKKIDILNNRYKKQDFFAFIDIIQDQVMLTGVDLIVLSQMQDAVLFPDSSYCILKPNRNFKFKGDLIVGKFEATLNEGWFSYEDFKVKLNQTSRATLAVTPLRPEDGLFPIELFNSFANLKGEILIDEPTSKSGKSTTNKMFPKLLVPLKTKVVYNDPSIVRGAYDSARFYYHLEPFELDSLDNFHELSQRFKGELISGGIFPPISEPLKIMPDYSLGFSTVAPPGGWAFYGENSKYENKVILSHNGLQGAGTINYSTATAISQKLTFLPDSTIGIAKFINKETKVGVQVPSVTSEGAYITFIPKKQILKASSWRGVMLDMFNNQSQMEGSVILSVKGMKGSGVMHFPDADLGSKIFEFTHVDIHADTASFSLKNRFINEGQAPVAMETKDVKADVSLETRKGEFNSFGTKRIKFPPNQYYCTMDRFFWYMDKANVDFEKSKSQSTTFEAGADLDESNFFSMHEEQDTLQFRSLLARYDLKLQTLFCNKVTYIRVGDAKIFPDSMKITIRKNAVMDSLNHARIVAPFITKFHTFTDANVNITSRKKYEGNAKYPYFDRDSNLTVIPMKSIKYLNSVTQAEGEISQKENFKLSKEFDYYGKIKIVAASPGIYCEGSTKINHECKSFDRSWLSFKDTLLAKNIQIPISENAVNDVGRKLAVGFLWKNSEAMDSVTVYPAFLSKMQGKDDPIVFQSSGYVQYNPTSLTFQIGDKERLNGNTDIGNLLTMYTESCSLTGMGKISFGVDLGEVTANSYGSINYDTESKKIGMDLTTLLKFPMQKDVFDQIGDGLKSLEGQKNADLNSKKMNFYHYVRHILTEEKVNDLFKDYEEEKLKKMPEGLNQTLVLSGLRFEFAQFKTKANESGFARGWVTKSSSDAKEIDDEGDEVKAKNKAVIVAIEGKPILKELDFNMVVSQTCIDKSYQGLMINFRNSADKDFLFDYVMNRKDGKLLVYSKEPSLKTLITEMKPDKRKSKNFSFDWSDDESVQLAMVRFKEYLKIK